MKPFIGTTLIKLLALVDNDRILKSDAIICLEGDGFLRTKEAARLFEDGFAKKIVVSGGYEHRPFSVPAKEMAKDLIKRGIPEKNIILEEKSQNTYEQAAEVLKIAKEKKWQSVILTVSHFHQLRAYLTFLKAMEGLRLNLLIFNSPVREIPWSEKTALGKTRIELLEDEFKKIEQYKKAGHIVEFKNAIKYQIWKEQLLKK